MAKKSISVVRAPKVSLASLEKGKDRVKDTASRKEVDYHTVLVAAEILYLATSGWTPKDVENSNEAVWADPEQRHKFTRVAAVALQRSRDFASKKETNETA